MADTPVSDLVDYGQIAEMLGLGHRSSARNLRLRYPDFPDPVIERGRTILWRRRDVARWIARKWPDRQLPDG